MPTLAGGARWLLCCYGLTLLVSASRLTAPLRQWAASSRLRALGFVGAGASCAMCVGFWAGGALCALGVSLGGPWWADALASSAGCWALHVTLARMGARDL